MYTFTQNNSLLLSTQRGFIYDPNKLVLVYDTSKEPTNNTISFPVNGIAPNITVDWGDNTSDVYTTTGWKTHTYSSPGIYVVQVAGNMKTLSFSSSASNLNNKLKLVRCLSFGNIGLTSLFEGFRNCSNLIEAPISLPTTSNIHSLHATFFGCVNFNSNISNWNTSSVTNINSLFNGCSLFNQNISSWNTSSVNTMALVFSNCINFNQNIGTWNTNNVLYMNNMFYNCINFNQNIGSWNTSNVINMVYIFYGCTSFNQNLSNWNVGQVLDMNHIFYNCDNFTSNLGSWNLSSLNIAGSLNNFMLQATGMTTADYDATLIGWNNNKTNFRNDLKPHFGGSKYSSVGASARASLIAYGWQITDGGLAP